MWDATGFSELPPLEAATSGNGSSGSQFTVLPTPTTSNAQGNSYNNRGQLLLPGVVQALLPTPRVQSGGASGGVDMRDRPNGKNLATAISLLLPTPRPQSKDGGGRAEPNWTGTRPSGSKQALNLATAIDMLLPTPLARDHKGSASPTGSPHKSRPGQMRGPGEAGLPQTVVKLLRTPGANLGTNGGGQSASKRLAGGHHPSVEDQVLDLPLLPTPLTGEARHGSPNQHRSRGDTMLTGVVIQLVDGQHLEASPTRAAKLLSTPRASDGGWEGEPGTHKGQRASSAGWGLRNETRSLVQPSSSSTTSADGAPMSPDGSTADPGTAAP
jgi:hypothetical protein